MSAPNIITVNFGPRRLTLCFDASSALELRAAMGDRTIAQIFGAIDAGSMRAALAVLWSGLRRHHPDIKITDVPRLLDAAGNMAVVAQILEHAAGAFRGSSFGSVH